MADARRVVGALGERLAVAHLQAQGYRIIGRNVRLRSGEIDIVAEEDGCLVLVEVRLRRSGTAGQALESVAHQKQRRLRLLAAEYYAALPSRPADVRVDVVGICLGRAGEVKELLLVRNAVEDC